METKDDVDQLLEAWDFGQLDDENLAAVPSPVREALRRHLTALRAARTRKALLQYARNFHAREAGQLLAAYGDTMARLGLDADQVVHGGAIYQVERHLLAQGVDPERARELVRMTPYDAVLFRSKRE